MTTAPLWTLCRRTLGAAFLIAAAATFVASTAVAQEAEPTFASANSAYQQGRYAEAAGQLEQLAAPIALYPDNLIAQILAAGNEKARVVARATLRDVRRAMKLVP